MSGKACSGDGIGDAHRWFDAGFWRGALAEVMVTGFKLTRFEKIKTLCGLVRRSKKGQSQIIWRFTKKGASIGDTLFG